MPRAIAAPTGNIPKVRKASALPRGEGPLKLAPLRSIRIIAVEPNRTPQVIDREALMDRVGGDVDFLQEIAGLFLEDCPKLLGEIRAAVQGGDARTLEHAAHTLKGSVANFGAEAAREAAFRLETLGRAGDLKPAPEAVTSLEEEIERFTVALNSLSSELAKS